MAATNQDLWVFIHRMDPDGSVESICPVCFETVGREETELDLLRAEHSHACDPDSLGNFAYFSSPAQD